MLSCAVILGAGLQPLTDSVVVTVAALMESMRSLDASCMPLNRDQFLDLASSLNDFFAQNGLTCIKSEPGITAQSHQMVPQLQMPMQPANFCQATSPQMYQNYPSCDDQLPSPGTTAARVSYSGIIAFIGIWKWGGRVIRMGLARSEPGIGFLGRGQPATPHQLGLGEHCKLPQWGLGPSRGRLIVLLYFRCSR